MARGGHLPSWSCGRNAARTPGAGPEDVACWGAPKSLASDAPGWAAQMCGPKTSAYLSPFLYFAPLLTKVRLATGSEVSPSRTLADPAQTPPWYAPHVSRKLHCPGLPYVRLPSASRGHDINTVGTHLVIRSATSHYAHSPGVVGISQPENFLVAIGSKSYSLYMIG